MECLINDCHGESSCEKAKYNIACNRFECSHECVDKVYEMLVKTRIERDDALRKLDAYRKALAPFIDNCRACIKIAEEM